MNPIIQKFGGSSLADETGLRRAANLIIQAKEKGFSPVVVASAPGKTTSELLERQRQIHASPDKRELDMLLSVGELISISLLAMMLEKLGHRAISLTGAQAGIITNGCHNNARILEVRTERIRKELAQGHIVVIAGYQGVTENGEVTTLGRGGSDTTAVALAVALDATACEIWTDVDGVYSAQPKLVTQAMRLPGLNFRVMTEMADAGAKVLKSSAAEMAQRFNIPVDVGCSYSGVLGTRIDARPLDRHRATGVLLDEDVVSLTLSSTNSATNFALIGQLSARGVLVKSIWERGSECGLIIVRDDLACAQEVIENHYEHGMTWVNTDLVLLSVVGAGINFGTDVVTRVFEVFSKLEIRPAHYFFSEMRITFAIQKRHAAQAVRDIHEALVMDGNMMPA